jgi:tetratricopeptide (TPR) repeat protein
MKEQRQVKNPFPGLRPFETDEYRLFFGREGQSDELLRRLQRSRFLAVVGTSGSGKSSLIRAGLLPALRGGMMADAGSGWRIAVMRPGGDPIGNLAQALAQKGVLAEAGGGLSSGEAEAMIEATLSGGSLGLVDAAHQGLFGEHEKLLVVVDQFEELFRFRSAQQKIGTSDEASAFVKLLIEAAHQRELSIYVVLTMRSDFLGDCAQFQGLPEAINEGQYLIPRMTRDERRFAVTGPVGVTRGKITEPLVNRLLNDVGDNPDQLPILQHALMRTWDHWSTHHRNGEPIGLEHYEAVGTMTDALSRHADEAWAELNQRQQVVAELLFKTLSERGADNREIRRPTCLQDICAITNATPAEVCAVIEVFRGAGRSFLMPPAGVDLKPQTVVDISHESLIRNWDRLRAWVEDEAQSARIYRRLAEAATDHYQKGTGLLDDVTLQFVLKWRDQSKPAWAWGVRYHPEFNTAMSFLELSTQARDARLEAEQERERRELETTRAFAAQQAHAAQNLRRFVFALVVISILAFCAAGGAVYAYTKLSTATRNDQLNRDALAYFQRGNAEQAEAGFKNLAELYKNDPPKLAWAKSHLGEVHRKLGKLDEGIADLTEAYKIQQAIMGDAPKANVDPQSEYQDTLNWLAQAHSDNGNYELAEPLYLEAVKFDRSADNLERLARNHDNLVEAGQAETIYDEALTLRRKNPNSPALIASLQEVAEFCLEHDRLDKARELYEETLRNQAFLEPYDANIADTFTGLSQVSEEMGLHDRAKLYNGLARAIRRSGLTERSTDVGSMQTVARHYMEIGKYRQAAWLEVRAQETQAKQQGAESQGAVNGLISLGDFFGDAAKSASDAGERASFYDRSGETYAQALDISERMTYRAEAGRARDGLTRLRLEHKDFAEAEREQKTTNQSAPAKK